MYPRNDEAGTISDFHMRVAMGDVPGVSSLHKFGRNPDVDVATTPEDIWDGGGVWTPPTAARLHDIVSTSTADDGNLMSSGTATGGSDTTIVDTGATFSSDGVVAGATVISPTTHEHSIVQSVTETILTLLPSRHNTGFASGDDYWVVNTASTGASLIHISGLDANMEEQDEFIVMNGTTNVPTVNTYWRIFRIHVDGAVDRDATNVGIITATAQTDATVTAQVNAGNGQTLMAIYTIPSGKTAYMLEFYAGMNRQGATKDAMANMILMETAHAEHGGSGSRVQHFVGLAVTGSSTEHHEYLTPRKILARTDIRMRCVYTSDDNIDIAAGFDLLLVDND